MGAPIVEPAAGHAAADRAPGSTRDWLRRQSLDLTLAAVGLVFSWVTLLYPFGRDQGLYYYVGREWVLRGSIPYRDVLDHKTPGIYILHAACVLVFGEKLWGIRLLEIVAVVLIGVVAASLATPRGTAALRGLRGFAVLAASVLYFGFFDFRETGEGEIWVALFGIAACMFVRRGVNDHRAALACGVLSGASAMMKPSAIFFIAVALALLLRRVLASREGWFSRAVRAAAIFGAGFALVWVPILGYFGAHHALADLQDIVVGANRYYVVHEAGVSSVGDFVAFNRWFLHWAQPLSTVYLLLLAAAFGVALVQKDKAAAERHVLGAVLVIAAWASVAMQGKFYLGHWSIVAGPTTVVLTNLASDAVAWLEPHISSRRWTRLFAPATRGIAASVALLFFLYMSADDPLTQYARVNAGAISWLVGRTSREDYLGLFNEHGIGGPAKDNEAAAIWVRTHSQPDDNISVRGFQPQIYAVAQRRYAGRFFWTTFLVNPARAYKRAEWLAEDRAVLAKNPPRYVVTVWPGLDNDNPDWWYPFGYSERARFGDLVVLERTPETATQQL
jgi:4-amino-4-deoxy-L-arabinose transferase-like glycosyltransferase